MRTATTQAQAAQDKLDTAELRSKVKAVCCDVAENPHGEFHFEMGRTLAERLGYEPTDPERIPNRRWQGHVLKLLVHMLGILYSDCEGTGHDRAA